MVGRSSSVLLEEAGEFMGGGSLLGDGKKGDRAVGSSKRVALCELPPVEYFRGSFSPFISDLEFEVLPPALEISPKLISYGIPKDEFCAYEPSVFDLAASHQMPPEPNMADYITAALMMPQTSEEYSRPSSAQAAACCSDVTRLNETDIAILSNIIPNLVQSTKSLDKPASQQRRSSTRDKSNSVDENETANDDGSKSQLSSPHPENASPRRQLPNVSQNSPTTANDNFPPIAPTNPSHPTPHSIHYNKQHPHGKRLHPKNVYKILPHPTLHNNRYFQASVNVGPPNHAHPTCGPPGTVLMKKLSASKNNATFSIHTQTNTAHDPNNFTYLRTVSGHPPALSTLAKQTVLLQLSPNRNSSDLSATAYLIPIYGQRTIFANSEVKQQPPIKLVTKHEHKKRPTTN